jgi:hypothetical protein
MDKTQLSARKRFRVLIGAGNLPLTKAETKLPHLTGLCTISVGGAVFKPIIILKGLKGLKSLANYTRLASPPLLPPLQTGSQAICSLCLPSDFALS